MSPSDSEIPAAGRSQTDVVIQGIKSMITRGEIAPGSRLPVEKDLATALSVSRGSLREGVRALAMMGVLETRQGDGTYVTSLDATLLLAPLGFMVDLQTPANSAHLQSVRRVLESEAAARAASRITDEQLAAAREVLDGIEPLVDDESADPEVLIDADIAFHRIIANAAGNPTLDALIEALAGRTARARLLRAMSEKGVVREAQSDHRSILAELVARDGDRARIRMSNHLLEVEEYIDSHATEADAAASGTAAQ